MISFSKAVKTCLITKYASMSGRATRAEYWWFQLFLWLSFISICFIGINLGDKDGTITLSILIIFWFVTLVPNLSVCVRRLHDRGHSGAMFFWCLLGLGFGLLIINIINMLSSDEDNKYGPNPNNPIGVTEIINDEL